MEDFGIEKINSYFQNLLNLIPFTVKNLQEQKDLMESSKDLPVVTKKNNFKQLKRAKAKECFENEATDEDLRHKLHQKIISLEKERNSIEAAKKDRTKPKKASKNNQKPSKADLPNTTTAALSSSTKIKGDKNLPIAIPQNSVVGNMSFAPEDGKRKSKKRSPEQLLQKAVSRDQTIKSLDSKKQAEIAEKDAWRKAALSAKGEHVKDDVKLLKKTLKKKEKKKEKTLTEWSKRTTKVKQDQKERAQKRNENIKERNQARKDKRMGIKKSKTKKSSKKHK